VAGERNLLDIEDFSSNVQSLRKLFGLFEEKTDMLKLLEISRQAQGVKNFYRWRVRRDATRRMFDGYRTVSGKRPDCRHRWRDWPDTHGLRTGDPDCGYHGQIVIQRAVAECGLSPKPGNKKNGATSAVFFVT
jgi:hypothetical protein